jgi:hypothetical protein
MNTSLNLRDIPRITEAELPSYQFSSEEIYQRPEDIRVRYLSLDKAVTLSGSKLVNTLLVINTTKGFRSLTSPIIGMNESGVALEGKSFIPMHAIYSVNIE